MEDASVQCLKTNHKSKDYSSLKNCCYRHKHRHQSVRETHLSQSTEPQEAAETSLNLANTSVPSQNSTDVEV